jgi:hypothetical protein
MRLLDLAGERNGYASPAEIFKSLAREIASYRELDFDAIGDQGIEVGAAVAERHDR